MTHAPPHPSPLPEGEGAKVVPTFAVVGHPNKGKSSIVATLAEDDSVAVSPEPGTTKQARKFPMRVDDRVLYVLVDTPGFQRARRALQWMREHETTAAKHPEVVTDFVRTHRGTDLFTDEVELLGPIMDGAGILYVVDGSKPYGPEYEAEMEILRWTGRPSMALINPIGNADHVDEWRNALGQYFRIVRVFNAVTEEFDKRLELLRAFGQLQEAWRAPLDEAVRALEAERARKGRAAARVVADLLVEALTHVERRGGLPHDAAEAPIREELLERFKAALRASEERARRKVEAIYAFDKLERREAALDAELGELFSKRSFVLFGLSKPQLVMLGAGSGLAAGLLVDAAVAGVSHGAGAVIGGVFGAAGAALGWFGSDKLADVEVLRLAGGGKELKCGPVRNANFPFVLLGRARYHHALIAHRTHAQRGGLVLEGDDAKAGALNPIPEATRRELSRLFTRLRKSARGDAAAEVRDELARVVEGLLATSPAPVDRSAQASASHA